MQTPAITVRPSLRRAIVLPNMLLEQDVATKEPPLALRLYGQLLLGVVRVYARKVMYLHQVDRCTRHM